MNTVCIEPFNFKVRTIFGCTDVPVPHVGASQYIDYRHWNTFHWNSLSFPLVLRLRVDLNNNVNNNVCVTASHSLWFIDLVPDSWTTVKKTVDYIWWSAKTNQTCPPSVLLSILVLNVVGSRRSLLLLQLTRMSSLRRSRVSYPGRRFLYIATWPLLQKKHINGLKKNKKTNGFDCSIVKIAMIACISTWVFSKLFHSE